MKDEKESFNDILESLDIDHEVLDEDVDFDQLENWSPQQEGKDELGIEPEYKEKKGKYYDSSGEGERKLNPNNREALFEKFEDVSQENASQRQEVLDDIKGLDNPVSDDGNLTEYEDRKKIM